MKKYIIPPKVNVIQNTKNKLFDKLNAKLDIYEYIYDYRFITEDYSPLYINIKMRCKIGINQELYDLYIDSLERLECGL